MRPSIWTAAAWAIMGLVGCAVAQEMPACASECLVNNLPQSECDLTDFDCICADKPLMNSVAACSMGACTLFEGLAAQNATATLCKQPVRDRSLVAPIATAITGGMALAFILVRLYERGVRKNELDLADGCAVVAFLSSVPMDVGEFLMMKHGMGKDIWTLTPTEITEVVKYTWVTQVAYIPAICLTKVTVLLFFMHVFPTQWFHTVCRVTIVHCLLFMVSTTVATILACIPVQAIWTAWTGSGEGMCYNNSAFWWAHSAINIVTDLWILGMPIPQLLKLQLGLRKKIYLVMMFSVGIVITIISVIRFSGLVQYSTSTNPTFNNVDVATYSVIECNISIMCCCMPSLLSFLRHAMPAVFGSTNRSNYKNGSYQLGGKWGTGGGSGKSGGGGAGVGTGGGRRKSSLTFPSSAIQKTVTHTVTYLPRAGDSDTVELMDREGIKLEDGNTSDSGGRYGRGPWS